jgi:single-stranded DNA-specific DHH superfamily exonuclease
MDLNKDLAKIKKILDDTHRPLIFFDDDPDGLCSFLMIYKFIGDGRGVPIKTSPDLSANYLRVVQDFAPDRIIILDKNSVSDQFISNTKIPILWIDHHPIQDNAKKVTYFNPLQYDSEDNSPTSYWVYKILNEKKFLWLSMIGCVADWFIPNYKDEFVDKYSDLFSKNITDPAKALFDTRVGKLVKIFDNCLKGTKKKVSSCIKILTRISDPEDLLYEISPKSKFIMKHFRKLNSKYDELLNSVDLSDEKLVEFNYSYNRMSYTSMLSNELQFRAPNKFILVAREKSGFMHCSLRSQKHDVRSLLDSIVSEFSEAYGGGHEHACGANIKASEYSDFVKRLRQELDNYVV